MSATGRKRRPLDGAGLEETLREAEVAAQHRAEKARLQKLGVFPTPPWATRAILPQLRQYLPPKERLLILEPAAGDGAIVQQLLSWGSCQVDCQEIRPECEPALEKLRGCESEGRVSIVAIRDFLEHPSERRPCDYDLVITNPPYKHALEFAQHALEYVHLNGIVVMLLRLGFLASRSRAEWLSRHMPDVHILSRRPSFSGAGTDATDYGWFVFRRYERTAGVVRPLPIKEGD
jgi:hypothetical protein